MAGAKTPFSSLLVANRGEIAVRIIRSARALGLRTIAVHSTADRGALHVRLADAAVEIGGAPVGESYLDGGRILDAARLSGAEAVHPGYGFLSENADFARAVRAAGLVFVGPSAEVIETMGDKSAAKRLMESQGVPTVPGFHAHDPSDGDLVSAAAKIGFPVMVKAAAGGGGRGLRRVETADEMAPAIARARSEAQGAFANAALLVERAVAAPRHVEVQILADRSGNVVHLGERDCSIQRRSQKVIEESPSPAVSPQLRARMCQAAITAVRAVGYEGAGTVEFLLDRGGDFFFLEMNTRLQVEHPVSEAVTGLDLVAMQIEIAAGEALALTQADITFRGHAIEARLYAEDPENGFLPSTGKVLSWEPPAGEGLRTDAGVEEGGSIAPWYDPLIAKVIAHGTTRNEARRRLVAALARAPLFGPATNRDFLIGALESAAFCSASATTESIDGPAAMDAAAAAAAPPPLAPRPATPLPFSTVATVAALVYRDAQARALAASTASRELAGWGSPGRLHSRLALEGQGGRYALRVTQDTAASLEIVSDDGAAQIRFLNGVPCVDGQRQTVRGFRRDGEAIFFADHRRTLRFTIPPTGTAARTTDGDGDGEVRAPMPGSLIALTVAPGERIAAGAPVAVLEAMKMQHEITAPISGTIRAAMAATGAQLSAGAVIVIIDPEPDAA